MAEARTSSPEEGQDKTRGLVDRVKESATAQLSNQKDRGTDALDRVAEAVRSSSGKLRDEQHDTIAGYIDKAADRIENWSRQLRGKDITDLMSDAQRLARRQPAVFIGSAFALGVLGARFLKSSQPNGRDSGRQSRRMQYGGNTGSGVVHDYGTRDRNDEAVTASEVSIPDVPMQSDTAPSMTTGAEGGARSMRGRRSTSRTEQG